jgi:hypothetical protein
VTAVVPSSVYLCRDATAFGSLADWFLDSEGLDDIMICCNMSHPAFRQYQMPCLAHLSICLFMYAVAVWVSLLGGVALSAAKLFCLQVLSLGGHSAVDC